MGSGIFPLRRGDDNYDSLLDCREEITRIADYFRDDIFTGESGGHQFDNAARDGAHLAYLRLAVELIEKCLES